MRTALGIYLVVNGGLFVGGGLVALFWFQALIVGNLDGRDLDPGALAAMAAAFLGLAVLIGLGHLMVIFGHTMVASAALALPSSRPVAWLAIKTLRWILLALAPGIAMGLVFRLLEGSFDLGPALGWGAPAALLFWIWRKLQLPLDRLEDRPAGPPSAANP